MKCKILLLSLRVTDLVDLEITQIQIQIQIMIHLNRNQIKILKNQHHNKKKHLSVHSEIDNKLLLNNHQ